LGKAIFSINALSEVLLDYVDQFEGKVFLGKRAGFMDELDKELNALDKDRVTVGPINEIIDRFVETINLD
jgi:CRISPR-associated protein Cst2